MTIANCLVIPDGVVFGADSTASIRHDRSTHYFNDAQKIYEVGKDSSIGAVSWGVSALGDMAVRTILHTFSRTISETKSFKENIAHLAEFCFEIHRDAFLDDAARIAALRAKAGPVDSISSRSDAEDEELLDLLSLLKFGLCVGGQFKNEAPQAYWFEIEAGLASPPIVHRVDNYEVFGQRTVVDRIIDGFDANVFDKIVKSPFWVGSEDSLYKLLEDEKRRIPYLPLRDAVDFVHFGIYSTIKGIKFSELRQHCGGAVEVAVITTDRSFRWVVHKELHSAI